MSNNFGADMTCRHADHCNYKKKESCSRFKVHKWSDGCDRSSCENGVFEGAYCVPVKKGVDAKSILKKAFPGVKLV